MSLWFLFTTEAPRHWGKNYKTCPQFPISCFQFLPFAFSVPLCPPWWKAFTTEVTEDTERRRRDGEGKTTKQVSSFQFRVPNFQFLLFAFSVYESTLAILATRKEPILHLFVMKRLRRLGINPRIAFLKLPPGIGTRSVF